MHIVLPLKCMLELIWDKLVPPSLNPEARRECLPGGSPGETEKLPLIMGQGIGIAARPRQFASQECAS